MKDLNIKKIIKKVFAVFTAMTILLTLSSPIYADNARVVTLGANLSPKQRQMMLDYFGVKEEEVTIITVNNQEERALLSGIATEEQLGHVTMSNSYVEPLSGNQGINVKTANITYVTADMIASTLTTAGVESANVVAAAPFPVSGTGALTGVMKAFEVSTGQKLDETKKKLASEELMVTSNLGNEVGQDKAAGLINDAKEEVIKDKVTDKEQIKEIVNNVVNNYNISLSDDQIQKITNLLSEIGKQNYNYNSIKNTLTNITNNVNLGEHIDKQGLLDNIKSFLSSLGKQENDFGIINQTNESELTNGANAIISATSSQINQAATSIGDAVESANHSGFFDSILEKIMNFINQ